MFSLNCSAHFHSSKKNIWLIYPSPSNHSLSVILSSRKEATSSATSSHCHTDILRLAEALCVFTQNLRNICTRGLRFSKINEIYCLIKDILRENWHVCFYCERVVVRNTGTSGAPRTHCFGSFCHASSFYLCYSYYPCKCQHHKNGK